MTEKTMVNIEYPGRLIIIGQERISGHMLVIYAITGRSASSQARKMEREEEAIWVKPTDTNLLKKGNKDLLIYPSVFFLPQGIAISNGKQTVDIMACMGQSESPAEILALALKNWDYEPDDPAFTPRISGCLLGNKRAALSLIRRAQDGSSWKSLHEFSPTPGKGKMIMTYEGVNKDPLPSFKGEPLDVQIEGSTPQKAAEMLYGWLQPKKGSQDLRVSIACVFAIDISALHFDAHIINRSEREPNAGEKIR
jgi:IMP cyclohydrolase